MWTEAAFWTILVACAIGSLCATLGVWLVLQRVSMLGDAISHAVLPGLIIGFMLFGTRAPTPMLLGAVGAGIATVVLTRVISRASLLREDAAMGVVFTGLFALGVILITRYARQIDLDPGCVLYGQIEFVALDTEPILGMNPPRVLKVIVPGLLVTLPFVLLFRKELTLASFDPALARALGMKPDGLTLGLMAMIAVATVVSFEAVGSILVVAMLIGPPAAAQLLTRKLRWMFLWANLVAIVASVAGYALAVALDTSVAGMVAACIGALYAGAVAFSPAGGLVVRAWQRRTRLGQIQEEDALAAVYRLRESGLAASSTSVRKLMGDTDSAEQALARLLAKGLATNAGGNWALSPAGNVEARSLVRRHRLLETLYVKELGMAASDVHPPVDRSEHFLTEAGDHELEESVADVRTDPHGRAIPERTDRPN